MITFNIAILAPAIAPAKWLWSVDYGQGIFDSALRTAIHKKFTTKKSRPYARHFERCIRVPYRLQVKGPRKNRPTSSSYSQLSAKIPSRRLYAPPFCFPRRIPTRLETPLTPFPFAT
jgi:hypothetical protein